MVDPAARRIDGYLPIEDYGAIGDGRTLALVGLDGAIDWMCLPNLDAPSTFAALLDPVAGGQFTLCPQEPFTAEHRYLEQTNVLETVFETRGGRVRVLDALTIDKSLHTPWRELVRQVQGETGEVPMGWRVQPRFEYGSQPAGFEPAGDAIAARHGDLQLGLLAWGPAVESDIGSGIVSGSCRVGAGERLTLALVATDEQPLAVPRREAVERRLEETCEVWRSWVTRHSYEGPWTAAVERSLLAIRLLADARTGAIAAAGTTSLPEALGGKRNYDYRFGWVRDLCFTLDALLAVGMDDLVHAPLGWLLEATSHTHPRVDPVYALAGDVLRSQSELSLPGYRGTAPVHVGNNAGSQLQLGGFGDLIETLCSYVERGHRLSPETGERLADSADLLAEIWHSEDSGFWELGDKAHYGSSKLGCWVAFARLLDLVESGAAPARNVERWRAERDAVRDFMETRLFDERQGSYLFKADDDGLDCVMLLAARRNYTDPTGERFQGTIDAVRRELAAEGALLYRYSGMRAEENAFLACSFWLVEALVAAGRREEARELMEQCVGLASPLGLYSEEMEPGNHAMRGNFPQALTHLALINAAVALARD